METEGRWPLVRQKGLEVCRKERSTVCFRIGKVIPENKRERVLEEASGAGQSQSRQDISGHFEELGGTGGSGLYNNKIPQAVVGGKDGCRQTRCPWEAERETCHLN